MKAIIEVVAQVILEVKVDEMEVGSWFTRLLWSWPWRSSSGLIEMIALTCDWVASICNNGKLSNTFRIFIAF